MNAYTSREKWKILTFQNFRFIILIINHKPKLKPKLRVDFLLFRADIVEAEVAARRLMSTLMNK